MLELCGHTERTICFRDLEPWRRRLKEMNQVKKEQRAQLPTEDRDDSAGLSLQREELFFLPVCVSFFFSVNHISIP